MRRTAAFSSLIALALLFFAAPAAAQTPRDLGEGSLLEHLERGDLADLPTDRYDEDLWSMAAFSALRGGQFVRARELSEQILDHDPQSVVGHCLMGLVYHRAEGNLPRAFFHLETSRELVEADWGPAPPEHAPWRWHAMALTEMAMVAGEMGRHRQKVELLLERDAIYDPKYPADRGWPLMRLRRYDAARDAVMEALELSDQPEQVAQALTALCAIEAEQQRRLDGYEACRRAAEWERGHAQPAPTAFTNAAEASLGLLRHDEAERLILEASENFAYGTVSNPYLDLMLLYLTEGRMGEALDASRSMLDWRNRQPVFMEEQNKAETEMASALFLLLAGHPEEAGRITRRALERPDRTGFTSSETEQLQAGAAVVDQLAHRVAAEKAAERASWSEPLEAARALATSLRLRIRAWSSSRRAASLVENERMLLATLRPYLAGSVEMPEWLEPELVRVMGSGVVAAALERAEARETLDEASGYFRALEAEIAHAEGDEERVLALVDRAWDELPGAEQLLRARLAGLGADAARRLGKTSRAVELYDRLLQIDPGTLRRLGLSLPVEIRVSEERVAQDAARYLARSPRFDVEEGAAFSLQVEADEAGGLACLVGPRGTRLSCGRVTPRAGDDGESLARRLAAELHHQAFAPRLDLTQADLQSLDGSPTAAGGRANERIRDVLDRMRVGG